MAVIIGLALTVMTVIISSTNILHRNLLTTRESLTKIVEQGNFCNSGGTRLLSFAVTWETFRNKPIWGYGKDEAIKQAYVYAKKNNKLKCFYYVPPAPPVHMHNQFNQVIIETGIVGLLLFIFLLYVLFRADVEDRQLSVYKKTIFIIFTVSMFFEAIFLRNYTLGLFSLIFGTLLSNNTTITKD